MKKIWSALLLLVLVLAAAGIASAETKIHLNTPTAAEISIPRDVAVFEFTPETDGYYRFYSGPWEEGIRNDTIGWILDEDRQLITQSADINEENNGCFSILYRLNANTKYYLAAAFYGYQGAAL